MLQKQLYSEHKKSVSSFTVVFGTYHKMDWLVPSTLYADFLSIFVVWHEALTKWLASHSPHIHDESDKMQEN